MVKLVCLPNEAERNRAFGTVLEYTNWVLRLHVSYLICTSILH